jgi:ParB family transcriptional regulator, chromosome partitioning protein
MADEVIQFDINQLQPNPLQPRGSINSETLVDLVDSIKEHGIMQPLVVAKTPAGYQIIAGERRWRASKLAGLTHVPVIIRETTPRGMLEMALVENVQRVDLNALDRAKGFERLQAEFALSTSEIAAQIGKSVAYVSNSLRLLSLPDALKDGLLSGLISEGHARALAAIDDPQLMVEAYKIILRESGSVRRAEELARRMKSQSGQASRITGSAVANAKVVSAKFEEMEKDMLNALANANGDDSKKPPVVKLARSQRETKLLFVLKGNVEETDAQLQKIYNAVTA